MKEEEHKGCFIEGSAMGGPPFRGVATVRISSHGKEQLVDAGMTEEEFATREEAEAAGLEVARRWVDQHSTP
ncbi:hypothetical protein LCGC14_1605250 [marine sediment metagenome]|uniref:Uncharacterized protein n=1 Tax=marine sediment metagenome TaxID=412755 RepID=A0A0F9IWJ8_9ZZZZ